MATRSAITATGIGKQYVIGGAEPQYESFRELLVGSLLSPLRRFRDLRGDVAKKNKFWALKGIDFEIQAGDIVGVIGHNGAGKSTLLKVLSRITSPTEGEVAIQGRVASLLEIGTGFHPELTGRENIFLNGSILGMRRRQIERRFDEIVKFADIEQFLDTPVKRYSSGMYVRLAFSVAAHLDTDVLLVDEVLAVGDQKFQEKCLGMLGEAGSKGRTVLFVSHNLASISKLCNRVMVLDKGRVAFNGEVAEGISHYNNLMHASSVLADSDYLGTLYPTISFSKISFDRAGEIEFSEGLEVDPFEDLFVTVFGNAKENISAYRNVFSVRRNGQLLFSLYDSESLSPVKKGLFKAQFKVPAKFLLPGEYTCSFGATTDHGDLWLWTRDYRFNVAYRWHETYDSTSSVAGVINLHSIGTRQQGSS